MGPGGRGLHLADRLPGWRKAATLGAVAGRGGPDPWVRPSPAADRIPPDAFQLPEIVTPPASTQGSRPEP